ncbi:short chain dehydrogenase family protein [Aspergillus saccharolyticus JOP 1030-1]|uniref:Short chain dehydrogenase family protein n=1 Tax=Aspergillus saccharolyticus JOP 1030-1 TaxID=1450539 RepID=A0A318ZYX1_9EURO|nr:short chain dehydrogenase family protein [Aspergillus saccharolyticus JOP 1030-1]PYH49400.1 short chain dehydrogenase family protein [Aspergillus saccharolyticus JOP 1030-1]
MASPNKPVALVIGASRGIGRQIAIDLAKHNYTVIIAAKSTSTPSKDTPFPPDPNSPASTITTVAQEINLLSPNTAYPIPVDVRSPAQIDNLVAQTLRLTSGRLDVVVYNSGAIWWSSVKNTPFKRFRLMQQVNPEGLYATVQAVLPVFERNGNRGRIVVVSPPVYSRFFRGKTGYAIGKVGMSVLTRGLAMDFVREGKTEMAITSIWPAAAIQSAATEMNPAGADESRKADLRKPAIFSDAVLGILNTAAHIVNGMLALDEDFLRDYCGVTDFTKYSLVPGTHPRRMMPKKLPVLEVEEQDDEGTRMDSAAARGTGSKL